MMNVLTWLVMYLQLTASRGYLIGFKFGKSLMVVRLDTLCTPFVEIKRESKKNGGGLALRLHVLQDLRKYWNNECKADYIMRWDTFEAQAEKYGYQLGKYFEIVCANYYGGEMSDGGARFDKSGDITVNGVQIQCKLDNATLTELSTIENAWRDKNEGV